MERKGGGEDGSGSKKERTRPYMLLAGLTLFDSAGVMFDPKKKGNIGLEMGGLTESGWTSVWHEFDPFQGVIGYNLFLERDRWKWEKCNGNYNKTTLKQKTEVKDIKRNIWALEMVGEKNGHGHQH